MSEVRFYGHQRIDWFVLNSSTPFSSAQVDIIEDKTETPSWATFTEPNTSLLNDFSGSFPLVSSPHDLPAGDQVKILIQKEENGITEPQIFSYPLESLPVDENHNNFIVDYGVKSNHSYNYNIAIADDTSSTAFKEQKKQIITDFNNFILYPLSLDTQQRKYSFKKVIDSSGKETVEYWSFSLNFTEDDITTEQNKTFYNTLTQFPKISTGEMNYDTGKFSALLGSSCTNVCYEENISLLGKWKKFIKSSQTCLFKNPKGEAKIIQINQTSSRKYMNEVANYYIAEDGEITSRPTVVSFDYTEIASNDKINSYVLLNSVPTK